MRSTMRAKSMLMFGIDFHSNMVGENLMCEKVGITNVFNWKFKLTKN